MAKCKWKQDNDWDCPGDYDTDCGHRFSVVDGTPFENEFAFCCFCGNPIVQVLRVDPPEETEP